MRMTMRRGMKAAPEQRGLAQSWPLEGMFKISFIGGNNKKTNPKPPQPPQSPGPRGGQVKGSCGASPGACGGHAAPQAPPPQTGLKPEDFGAALGQAGGGWGRPGASLRRPGHGPRAAGPGSEAPPWVGARVCEPPACSPRGAALPEAPGAELGPARPAEAPGAGRGCSSAHGARRPFFFVFSSLLYFAGTFFFVCVLCFFLR